jgi:hypothetical protein
MALPQWLLENRERGAYDCRKALYGDTYPAVTPGAVVKEGHRLWCADYGHDRYHIKGVLQPYCPRCGSDVRRRRA